ncbi:NAD(P)/FAD-dependent oxidoreductase [Rhodovibrionaceae bacterium A322]
MNYPDSLYAATAAPALDAPKLDGEESCDVCIIGGGYSGLSAALHLSRRGYSVILLEAAQVGFGASGRNGGQLGSAHTVLQPDLAKEYGTDHARALWDLTEDAKALVKQLIADEGIDCAYQDGNLGCAVTQGDVKHLAAHADMVARDYGYQAYDLFDRQKVTEVIGSPVYAGGLYDPTGGHLHPLNLSLGLARAAQKAGARIFEQSFVRQAHHDKKVLVKTGGGQVTADYLLYCCNGYLGHLASEIAPRILPADNYQIATEPLPDSLADSLLTNGTAAWDMHNQVYYYRLTQDRRLIFGGGVGLPGRVPDNLDAIVRDHMLKVYPQLTEVRIDYAWSGTFCNTRNKLPDFGRLADNVFYVQGYTGHGVALANLGGQLLAEVVDNTAGRFDVLASLNKKNFPGGRGFRLPVLALGLLYVNLLDKLNSLRR